MSHDALQCAPLLLHASIRGALHEARLLICDRPRLDGNPVCMHPAARRRRMQAQALRMPTACGPWRRCAMAADTCDMPHEDAFKRGVCRQAGVAAT